MRGVSIVLVAAAGLAVTGTGRSLMRSAVHMRHVLSFLVVCVLAAIVAATSSAGPSARSAVPPIKPAVFTDPAGDNGAAADVTTVTVTNDTAGVYTFDITFATPYASNDFTVIYLDTDANRATGSTNSGSEYLVGEDHSSTSYFFARWNGTGYDDVSPLVAPHVRVENNHLIISIDQRSLDNTAAFNFYVSSRDDSGVLEQGHLDDAPDTGSYHYAYQAPLSLFLASTRGGTAAAGGSWTYGIGVRRSDTSQTVGSEGTIACHATGGGKALAVVSRAFVSAGAGAPASATCRVHVPKTLRGKLVHGTIVVSYQGLSVSHTFVGRAH